MWRRKYIILAIALLAIIGGLVVWRTWWQNTLGRIGFYTTQPISYGYQIGSVWKQNLLNGSQQANITTDIINRAELETLRLENEQLRRELSLLPKQKFNTLGVEIIGKRQDETGTTFLLNRGTTSQIQLGDPILSSNALVGLVIKVQTVSAEMILINSPLFSSTVEILNNQSSRGLAEGEFNLATKIKLLPADEDIQIGQLVISSGLNELIPRGIVLGTIAAVEKKEGDLFQEALVISPVNLSKLGILQVVIK